MPAYSLLKQEQLQHKLVFIISEAKRKTRFDHCPVDPNRYLLKRFNFPMTSGGWDPLDSAGPPGAHHSSRLTETNAQRVLLSKRIRPMPCREIIPRMMRCNREWNGKKCTTATIWLKHQNDQFSPCQKVSKKTLVKARFQEVECDRFVEKCHIQSHCKQYTLW